VILDEFGPSKFRSGTENFALDELPSNSDIFSHIYYY